MTVYEALIIFLSDFQIYENVNLKQGKLARQKHVLYNMLDVDFQWKWGWNKYHIFSKYCYYTDAQM